MAHSLLKSEIQFLKLFNYYIMDVQYRTASEKYVHLYTQHLFGGSFTKNDQEWMWCGMKTISCGTAEVLLKPRLLWYRLVCIFG